MVVGLVGGAMICLGMFGSEVPGLDLVSWVGWLGMMFLVWFDLGHSVRCCSILGRDVVGYD